MNGRRLNKVRFWAESVEFWEYLIIDAVSVAQRNECIRGRDRARVELEYVICSWADEIRENRGGESDGN